jgi:hypothetical protein
MQFPTVPLLMSSLPSNRGPASNFEPSTKTYLHIPRHHSPFCPSHCRLNRSGVPVMCLCIMVCRPAVLARLAAEEKAGRRDMPLSISVVNWLSYCFSVSRIWYTGPSGTRIARLAVFFPPPHSCSAPTSRLRVLQRPSLSAVEENTSVH